MKKVLRKSNLAAGVLILIVVCLGIVFAADVIVKEGTLEAENINATGTIEGAVFKSTGCTASGTNAVAFGYETEASGDYSTAMGLGSLVWTTASGDCSTAIGMMAKASGDHSTAIGTSLTAGPASWTTAIGKGFINNVQSSFVVGYVDEDFRVTDDYVYVYGNLDVTGNVDADSYTEHSSFYDKDTYGSALNYSEDSSRTIKLNAEGEKEYNHEADPVFLQKWVPVTDYDTYTEEEVWDDVLNKTITRRIYETHQELRSDLGMKAAWLRQCVFELKQENQMLKDEIARLKEAVGIE